MEIGGRARAAMSAVCVMRRTMASYLELGPSAISLSAGIDSVGVAVFATEASRVTEDMFIVAAHAVAEQVTDEDLAAGLIYPPQSRILEASLHVAERVAACIFDEGLARVPRPDDIGTLIRARAYHPVYPVNCAARPALLA